MNIVIVDMCPPFSLEICQTLSLHLLRECTLAVFSRSVAPIAMSVGCLGVHYEVLYPLQPISQKLHALKQSIVSLVQYYQDTPIPSNIKEDTLIQCFENLDQALTALRNNIHFSHIDILLITCNNNIKQTIDNIMGNQLKSWNKKVTVLTITETLSSIPVCLTEVDDVTIKNNAIEIQKSLRKWFCGSMSEEKQPFTLLLPNDIKLVCDVLPCLINVETLPGMLQQSLSLTTPLDYKIDSIENQNFVLKAVKLLKSDAVCESVLFGYPMLLSATTHWQLDWEDLEKNQTQFTAFCSALSSTGCFMLCESTNSVRGKFLILPGSGGTALIKSLACSELVVPQQPTAGVHLPDETKQLLDDSLTALDIQRHHYSPLEHVSGIQDFLINEMEPSKRKLFNENHNYLPEQKMPHTKFRAAKDIYR